MPTPTIFRQIILAPRRATPSAAYDPATEAFFVTTTGAYSDADKAALNDFIVALKAADAWNGLDGVWLYAYGDNQGDSILNIKSPGVLPTGLINSPAWVRRQGFSSGVGNRYMSIFNPVSVAGNYAQNSAYVGWYCRSSRTGNSNATDFGFFANSVPVAFFRALDAVSNFGGIFNGTTAFGNANNTTLSYFAVTRNGSGINNGAVYRNKTQIGTSVQASTGNVNGVFFLGCLNSNGSPVQFTLSQYSALLIGAHMTQVRHDAIADALTTLMTYLGANV